MYSFMSNNVKIKLLPSKENEPKPSKGNGKNLLTRKEFMDEMLTFVVVFVLLGKVTGEEKYWASGGPIEGLC